MVARAGRQGKAGPLWRGLLLLATLLAGLAPAARALETGELTLHTRQGPLTYLIEIARTPAERRQGLMFREELARDQGMLFDFGQEQRVSFWMKNTPLPLDLLFIDATGRIVALHEQAVPFSEELILSGQPVQYVLEILGGTAKERGIRIGDRLGRPLFQLP